MRHFLILLIFIPYFCLAAEVTCYSYGKQIYHGHGRDFILEDNIVAFTEIKNKHLILVNGECIIKDL